MAQKSNTQGKTILVVEDEDLLRLAVSRALQQRGYRVIEARDGSIAMDLVRRRINQIDAILLDVTLPGKPSREIFEEAKRVRPDLKVILSSAYDKRTVDGSFTGMQTPYFIRKPFQLGELAAVLQDALSC